MPFATLAAALALVAAQEPQVTRDNPLGLPPAARGPVRITRVEDPKVICFVLGLSESRAAPAPIATVGRKARITRDGEIITVSMKAAPRDGGSRSLVCRLDGGARRVTSVRYGGRELLAKPTPY